MKQPNDRPRHDEGIVSAKPCMGLPGAWTRPRDHHSEPSTGGDVRTCCAQQSQRLHSCLRRRIDRDKVLGGALGEGVAGSPEQHEAHEGSRGSVIDQRDEHHGGA